MALCPECQRNIGKLFAVETINKTTSWFIYLCPVCEYDWTEDYTWRKEDVFRMRIDAEILGVEIFEAGNKCLYMLNGRSSLKSKEKITEECLKELREIMLATTEAERRWGRIGMYKIIKDYSEEVFWGMGSLKTLIEEMDEALIIKKRASEVISYLNTFNLP